MNIKDAKEQIKNAMIAYFEKDGAGNYIIPPEKQRPVFLMGPPGIGKTAVMEQIASEMGVGLLSYSMTHHTRQSALGLPFIVHKTFDGMEYDISEYTMSEIIASIYNLMENTGLREGILFLDEINCVSETLAPVMLQFLQYKIFGRHRVPDGWIVVTAGNPPEYNNSVREFDIVTWDRLKTIDVEPDFDAWKEYAYKEKVHPAIMTYLEIKKADFYSVETTADGKSFVTARGWDDMSRMIALYERKGITVDERLISQYVKNAKIAHSFSGYYELWNKYKSDYQINDILDGKSADTVKQRASEAGFDERLSLLGLILDALGSEISLCMEREEELNELSTVIKQFRLESAGLSPNDAMLSVIKKTDGKLSAGKKAGNLSYNEKIRLSNVIAEAEQLRDVIRDEKDPAKAFSTIKKAFDGEVRKLKKSASAAGKKLSNVFKFCEDVFDGGQEMLILVTELTANYYCSGFISRYGCEEYYAHNKELLFYERQKEIIAQIDGLSDDEI